MIYANGIRSTRSRHECHKNEDARKSQDVHMEKTIQDLSCKVQQLEQQLLEAQEHNETSRKEQEQRLERYETKQDAAIRGLTS